MSDIQPEEKRLLAQAHEESRILVTIDKDFGELAILRNQPHSGIIRLVGFSVAKHASISDYVLAIYGNELHSGA